MLDMDAVVRFVLSNAEKYGFDLSNVFLVGDSAGAHMAAMYCNMCTDRRYASLLGIVPPEGFVPSAVVLYCGIYDICEMLKDPNPSVVLLKPLVKDLLGVKALPQTLTAEQDALLCPAKYINKSFPTVFVMTALGDFLVRQPDCILPVLERNGVRHVFKVYGTEKNRLSHVFHCDLRLPEAKECNDDEMDFLKAIVRGE